MRGAIPPLPQYAFMAWCSVKAQGKLHIFFFYKRLGGKWRDIKQQTTIHFSVEKGMLNHQLGTAFFVHNRIISAVKRVEFVSDRM
jgi:hypothetical protein